MAVKGRCNVDRVLWTNALSPYQILRILGYFSRDVPDPKIGAAKKLAKSNYSHFLFSAIGGGSYCGLQ
jgi:hypothetical protein